MSIDFIKELLSILNMKEDTTIVAVFVLAIIIMLFRNFYLAGEKTEDRELEDIRKRIQGYTIIVKKIELYRNNKISMEDLYFSLYDLLEFSSILLRRMIIELKIDDVEAMAIVIKRVERDFNCLKLNEKDSYFYRTDEGVIEYISYMLRSHGVFRAITSVIMSIFCFVFFLVFISLFYQMTTYNLYDKIFYGANIIFIAFYSMVILIFIDLIIEKRFIWSLKNTVFLIILVSSLVVVSIFTSTSGFSIVSWIACIYISFNVKKMVKKRDLFDS